MDAKSIAARKRLVTQQLVTDLKGRRAHMFANGAKLSELVEISDVIDRVEDVSLGFLLEWVD